VELHAIEDGLHNLSTNVFKINIDSVGGGGDKLLSPIGVFVVDRDVKGEIIFYPSAFVIRPGNADNATAVDFPQLANDATGGAGGARNNEGLARLRLGDFEEAEIGGETVEAKGTEEVGVRKERDGRELLKSTGIAGSDHDVFLKASQPHELVAFFEVRMARFENLGKAEGTHYLAQLHRRHVLGDIGHPDAHCGVDGQVFDASQSLAFGERGNHHLSLLKDVGSNELFWAGSENPLAIGRHEGRIVQESLRAKRHRSVIRAEEASRRVERRELRKSSRGAVT